MNKSKRMNSRRRNNKSRMSGGRRNNKSRMSGGRRNNKSKRMYGGSTPKYPVVGSYVKFKTRERRREDLYNTEVTGKITEYLTDPNTAGLLAKMHWTPPPPQPKPITEVVYASELLEVV